MLQTDIVEKIKTHFNNFLSIVVSFMR